MVCKYDDYDWAELEPSVQAAASKLGFTPAMWDADEEPDVCDEYWKDLSEEQKAAAATLGYTGESWNAEDSDDE